MQIGQSLVDFDCLSNKCSTGITNITEILSKFDESLVDFDSLSNRSSTGISFLKCSDHDSYHVPILNRTKHD